MKRGGIIISLALFLGGAGFFLVRWQKRAARHVDFHNYAQHGPNDQHAELDWLKSELHVSDLQMDKVRALHIAYHPICESLTQRLEASHRKLDALSSTATSLGAEMDAALQEHSAIHLECQRAMLKHFYETAAILSPDQARRYLKKMIPFVFVHEALHSPSHSH